MLQQAMLELSDLPRRCPQPAPADLRLGSHDDGSLLVVTLARTGSE